MVDTCHFANWLLPFSGPSFGFSRLITLQRNEELETEVRVLHCFIGMCHPGCLLPIFMHGRFDAPKLWTLVFLASFPTL